MQSGRTIYYRGNSVEPPHPSEKNRRRRKAQAAMAKPQLKMTENTPKVCATSQCLFCGNAFAGGEFRVTCYVCASCQYCGLVTRSATHCYACGNSLPDDLKEPFEKKRIIVA